MKYYRVKKDTFLWAEGAVLKINDNGYIPIEDIWNKTEDQTEYITCRLVEKNPEWFERVYKDDLKGLYYRTKDQMVELYGKTFNV